jgi:hypothetical protein
MVAMGLPFMKQMVIVHKWGYPKNGRFVIDNPIQMDDLGVPPFQETPQIVVFHGLPISFHQPTNIEHHAMRRPVSLGYWVRPPRQSTCT